MTSTDLPDLASELARVDDAARQAEQARDEDDLPAAVRHLAVACVPRPPRTSAARALLADAIADALIHGEDTEGADLAREVAAQPDALDRCFDLGYRLMHHGLAHLAEAFLAPAALDRPQDAPVWLEYLAALDRIGRHDRALEAMDANPALLERSAAVRYLTAFHALMTGALNRVRQLLPTLDDPVDEVVAAGHRRLAAVLARADALGPLTPLDRDDLRGWHLALNGGLLLTLSDESVDTMRGRWALFAPQPSVIAQTLQAAAHVLRQLGQPIPRVLAGPDRDSQIVAHALARMLDVPLDPLSTDGAPGLCVIWDPDALPPPVIAHLQRIHPEHPVFACGVRWTEAPPFAPDLVGWLHQILIPPWAGGLTRDPHTGHVSEAPVDDRPVERIAAELAGQAVSTDRLAVQRCVKLVNACQGLPDAQRPGLLRTRGLRPLLWEGAPVTSARFL